MKHVVLIGLDLGTQGVRAMAATPKGEILCSAAEKYTQVNVAVDPLKEQLATDWEQAALRVLQDLARQLKALGQTGKVILSVDGTSGTIVPLDRENKPLRSALMYNDSRSKSVVSTVHAVCAALEAQLGYKMGSSFGLPKILWIRENQPEIYEKTAVFAHQADFLVGRLTGIYNVTDYSNALKTGYDLLEDRWPEAELSALGLPLSLLPRVVTPGAPIGPLSAAAAAQTGLPADTLVVAGVTDGYASCVASGAVKPGQFNTTIGTTLVIKGVTENFIKDPLGRVYCHKHPQGYWYPGGAGNVGGLCLNQWFGAENFDRLNGQVPGLTPTGNLIYPLTTRGERFPFVNTEAEWFQLLKNDTEAARYAGTMEGVGYVERLCYDTLRELGCTIGDTITVAGGAVKAPVWSQIRANILGKHLAEPAVVEAAYGSAIIAGTVALDRTLTQAAEDMIRYTRIFAPQPELVRQYDELYAAFVAQCRERGYV